MRDRWTLTATDGKYGIKIGMADGVGWVQKLGAGLRKTLWMLSDN